MVSIARRRICWPNPDATCLEGGCGYCNGSPFRSVASIRRYAALAGVLPNRGTGQKDAMEAFQYGLANDFFNTESRS
jgi:hypothetical protein